MMICLVQVLPSSRPIRTAFSYFLKADDNARLSQTSSLPTVFSWAPGHPFNDYTQRVFSPQRNSRTVRGGQHPPVDPYGLGLDTSTRTRLSGRRFLVPAMHWRSV